MLAEHMFGINVSDQKCVSYYKNTAVQLSYLHNNKTSDINMAVAVLSLSLNSLYTQDIIIEKSLCTIVLEAFCSIH